MSSELYVSTILDSVKLSLGIPVDHEEFDQILATHINSVFAKLNQMGVGSNETFYIEDGAEEWDDFEYSGDINLVRSYMYLAVRLLFDPPTASLLTSMEKMIEEYEWRLSIIGSSNEN